MRLLSSTVWRNERKRRKKNRKKRKRERETTFSRLDKYGIQYDDKSCKVASRSETLSRRVFPFVLRAKYGQDTGLVAALLFGKLSASVAVAICAFGFSFNVHTQIHTTVERVLRRRYQTPSAIRDPRNKKLRREQRPCELRLFPPVKRARTTFDYFQHRAVLETVSSNWN